MFLFFTISPLISLIKQFLVLLLASLSLDMVNHMLNSYIPIDLFKINFISNKVVFCNHMWTTNTLEGCIYCHQILFDENTIIVKIKPNLSSSSLPLWNVCIPGWLFHWIQFLIGRIELRFSISFITYASFIHSAFFKLMPILQDQDYP